MFISVSSQCEDTDLLCDSIPIMKIDRCLLSTALICSFVAVLLVQVAAARIQFNTGDEGWLWYDFQRTLAGEWPLRDFNAYDPGRYLFLTGWARLWQSDGIIVMRYALALVQWMALFPALLLIARAIPVRLNAARMILLAVTLALWMVPRHKIFDVGATVWMTCVLAELIAKPSCFRYRMAGLAAGLFWLIGRNHLLYGTFSIVLAWLWVGRRNDSFGWWRPLVWMLQGYLAGLLPMVVLLCRVHGYAAAYWRNAVVRLIEIGSTNLPLPVPWPWKTQIHGFNWRNMEQATVGLGFLLLPTIAVVTVAGLVFRRLKDPTEKYPLLIAAAITTLAWANQAFSRADLPHLAQASLPLAILLLTIPWTLPRLLRPWAIILSWGSFFAITFLAMIQLNPAFQAYVQPAEKFFWEDINGEQIYVPASTAADYHLALAVVKRAGPHPSILFAPYVPGLYAAFRLKCPIFDDYPLYPKTGEEQRQSIDAIRHLGTTWAVVWPYRMDGRPDLGFDRTDPVVWDFILKHFQAENVEVPAGYALVLHRPATRPDPMQIATVPDNH